MHIIGLLVVGLFVWAIYQTLGNLGFIKLIVGLVVGAILLFGGFIILFEKCIIYPGSKMRCNTQEKEVAEDDYSSFTEVAVDLEELFTEVAEDDYSSFTEVAVDLEELFTEVPDYPVSDIQGGRGDVNPPNTPHFRAFNQYLKDLNNPKLVEKCILEYLVARDQPDIESYQRCVGWHNSH